MPVSHRAYPTFRFIVEINGKAVGAFTECTMPSLEWDILDVEEGGQNRFVHSLPGRRKKATLTLKSGIALAPDMLRWYKDALTEKWQPAPTRSVTIKLMDEYGTQVMLMGIERCVPVKWTGPALKPDENVIAIQTLELACGEVSWDI
ncbi:MAG: phage tail protein [Anaerolineales bacterium]|nr:phage tail protein [Anaerolineales bacterium]MCB8961475.1 phage tail protein [Ardenticatenales bacterium]MCB0007182.1 phage tail protein [Anaerolineales bacterium]MCB0010833.1 phage tail protein [Anaerolineales bacterium]MCB0017571.1 phage tail protein [Anaerolineales bacterium]